MFTITFDAVSVAAAQDLLSVLPAANEPIRLHYAEISQSTEAGDAAEEGLNILITTGNTTVGSGGSAQVPTPLDINDAAADATGRKNDTTAASAGTLVKHYAGNWNVRTPFVYMPTPEMRPRCQNAEYLCLRLITVPADAIIMSGFMVFEEM
jgi:hypothetical protein